MFRSLFHFNLDGAFRSHPWLVCSIVAGTVLLRMGALAVYGVSAASLKGLVFHRLRVRLYQRFMFEPYAKMSQASHGFLTNTLQVEAPRVAELIEQLSRIPINASGVAVFFIVLASISWPVALLAATSGLALASVMRLSRAHLHGLSQRMVAANEGLATRMLAGIQSLRTIRAFGAESREFDYFVEASRAVAQTSVRCAAVENVVMPSATIAGLATIAAVILFSTTLGNEPAATLTMVALLFRLQPQVQGLQSSLTSIHGLESSLALIVRIIDEDVAGPPERRRAATSDPAEAIVLRRAIRFDDVSYSHPASAVPTVRRLDFEIRRGEVTALIGPSGAGKTTILNLLLRLTEPSSGSIDVDGADLSSIDRFAWLRSVAITGQDIDVTSGTVLDNLRLGAPALSPAEAMDALTLAGAAEFMRGLPDGLATAVGERGYRLSGGQRQRIALARAIAMKPQLLILDEATNAVDAAVEKTIFRSVRAAFPDLTILIVAHRGSALQDADAIVEIADGQVRSIRRAPQMAVS